MYVALVQFNPITAALRANAQRALEIIDELAAMPYPPDLVVFPAYALTGVKVGGLVYHGAFVAECIEVTRDFIASASLPTLFGTLIPRPLEDRFSFICEPEIIFCRNGAGGALGFVDATNSWSFDRYASSIDIELDGHTITVVMDDLPEESDDFSRSELVIVMLAKEYENNDLLFTASAQIGYLRSIAVHNQAWLVVVNLVGGEDEIIYDGGSLVLDAHGAVKDSVPPFVEQVLMVNLDLDAPALNNLNEKDTKPRPRTQDSKIVKPLLPYEADWNALVVSIRDFVTKNGFSDVVIGISGGIDSALVATLATEALGNTHVHGVLMPGPFSSKGSVEDATALADSLGIDTITFPITDAYELFKKNSTDILDTPGSDTALENIQSRLRTIILMHLSNTYGWLLLNTGNRSEAAMGYSTLYGDTAGAFAPLGNIYKTDVFGLAAWHNEKEPLIPQAILEKPPSAELREDQLDSDSLPPYEELDRILRLHLEDNLGVDQILEISHQQSGEPALDPETVVSVLERVKRAEFKRRQEPLGPELGSIDMNRDRWWPITNGFVDHDRHLLERNEIYDYLNSIYLDRGPSDIDLWGN